MNCLEFERKLEQLVDGELPDAARREAEEHFKACTACRELEAMARASMATSDSSIHAGFAETVLARTTGPACGRTQDLLGGYVDESLAVVETELVRVHLSHCRGCEEMAETLAWVCSELPEMAEIEPGPRFTADVLRATVGQPRPGFLAKLGAWSAGLVWRPRLAMEGAYVGAAVLWLLFGAGFSPFSDIPARALELATVNPAPVMEASLSSVTDLLARPVNKGWEAWQSANSRLATAVEGNRVLMLTRSFGWNGVRMVGELLRGDMEKSRAHLDGMITDLKEIWYELSSPKNNAINLKEA